MEIDRSELEFVSRYFLQLDTAASFFSMAPESIPKKLAGEVSN